jgi:N-acyl-D-glutamate deacylase
VMQAIEKASLVPARILEASVPQMKAKGRIASGADADLIVFDPATVTDRATFAAPAQTSVGMHYVIVNGTPVIWKGKLIRDALPGRPIRAAVRTNG